MPDADANGALQQVLDVALSFDPAAVSAQHRQLREKYPRRSRQRLTKWLIARHSWLSVGVGFGTGLPANPWVSVPAAVADVGIALRSAVLLVARIALLFDEAYFDDPRANRYELMVPVMGADQAGELAKQLAVRSGSNLTSVVVRDHLTQQGVTQVKRLVTQYVGVKVSQRALFLKSVPVLGGGIGAVWNYLEQRAVGRRAYTYYSGRPWT